MNLIAYESSDEEDVAPISKSNKPVNEANDSTRENIVNKDAPILLSTSSNPEPAPIAQPSEEQGPLNGPTLGPTASPPPTISGPPEDAEPGSPYTAERSLIRTLTLPTVANFDIPPSPPGSPPLRATTKFTQFLELKKKGQHFNQRLETSSVLKDPAHLQRLLDFAGISEEEQYASTLPEGLAVPTTFPKWAYVEELNASQKKITKAKEEANARNPRDAIDFVPATVSGTSSGTGTPSGKARQSGAERVMAGLDRPQPGKRKDMEYRGGRNDSSSRTRSPKRRRSRSRDRR